MNITVRITKVYGKDMIYPVCEQAKLFARLAGTKTFTVANMQTIIALGYEINVEQYNPFAQVAA